MSSGGQTRSGLEGSSLPLVFRVPVKRYPRIIKLFDYRGRGICAPVINNDKLYIARISRLQYLMNRLRDSLLFIERAHKDGYLGAREPGRPDA